MILQFGALLSGLVGGLGGIIQQAAPTLLQAGGAFLQRELTRKDRRRAARAQAAQATAVLNTPGISVSRLGGTRQPVGGGSSVRRSFRPPKLPHSLHSGTYRFYQYVGGRVLEVQSHLSPDPWPVSAQ